MVVTLLPFLSMFSAALAPSGTYPNGLEWPADPQWGNFAKAFEVAKMDELLWSSALIVVGVVPVSVLIATMAGYGLAKLTSDRYRWLYLLFVAGLTLPFEAVITPLYYEVRALGLLNTRFAIILPLIGLYMPFSVYWMRAHFLNVPRDLTEAAQLDGASRWERVLAGAGAAGPAGHPVADDPVVPVDVEPVPAAGGAGPAIRCSAPWPARLAPSRASGAPTCRCSAPARC